MITHKNIKEPYLKAIFQGHSEEAQQHLTQIRLSKLWEYDYEHDALLAFWLAVHKGDIQTVRTILDYDVSFRYIACLAFHRRLEKSPTEYKKPSKRQKRKYKGFGGS